MSSNMEELSEYSHFSALDIRVGYIKEAHIFEKAKKPAYILIIDFGALGVKKSSAQITDYYTPKSLIGKQVIAIVNLPPKQIGPIQSECLVLGACESDGKVVLLSVDKPVKNGLPIA